MILNTLALAGALLVGIQDTDTVFAAAGATRVDIEGASGEVIVRGWDRDQIRVRAEHSRRTSVDIRHRAGTVFLEAEGRNWTAIADFQIDVPSGMDISIEGFNVAVDVEGVGGGVEVSTIQGDVRVVGGRGDVRIETVNGRVDLEDVDGQTEVSSPAGNMIFRNIGGELRVEAVGGSVRMENMRTNSADVSSVGGRIEYQGDIATGGEYYFGSHGGSINLVLPPGVGAEINAASVMGRIRVNYPGAPQPERKDRLRFTVGDGSAEVDLETYGGTISIREPGGDRDRP